jgi:hypothetical protein
VKAGARRLADLIERIDREVVRAVALEESGSRTLAERILEDVARGHTRGRLPAIELCWCITEGGCEIRAVVPGGEPLPIDEVLGLAESLDGAESRRELDS